MKLFLIEELNTFIVGLGTGMGIFLVFIIIFLSFPEKFQKAFAVLCSLFKKVFNLADKQYTKQDLQGRVNDFVKRLDKKMYSFVPVKMSIKFFNNDKLEGFESGNKYLIRVKRDINPNTNFVNIVMFFLSKYLLLKAKKQISQKQQQSIDLFVAKKLFEEEKQSIMSEFVDSFLQPKTDDEKIRDLFDKYTNTDRAGLFFPIFLQEMVFLGERVFSNPRNHKIQEEVKHLINFLNDYAQREIGDKDINNKFKGQFSKFTLMIVGMSHKIKLNQLNPYIKYIKALTKEGVESIYLIGNTKNEEFIKEVGKKAMYNNNTYEVFKEERYSAVIKKNIKENIYERQVNTFLSVLRKKNPEPFIQN